MSLRILHQIRYAQEEPEETQEARNMRLWRQKEIDAQTEQERLRAQTRGEIMPWTQYGGQSRKARIIREPDGTLRYLVMPGYRPGPTIAGPGYLEKHLGETTGLYAMHINPSKTEAWGPSFQEAVEGLSTDDEGYIEGYPGFLIGTGKHKGPYGWVSHMFSPSKGEKEENERVNSTFLHPSLLEPRKYKIPSNFLKHYEEQKDIPHAKWNFFLANFINDYVDLGIQLSRDPNLNDDVEISKFWNKWKLDPKFIDMQSELDNPGRGNSLYSYMWSKAHFALRNELGFDANNFLSNKENTNDAIETTIDNVFRKLLSGYFVNRTKLPTGEVVPANIQGYVNASINDEMKDVVSKLRKSINQIGTESDVMGFGEDDGRTLADVDVDPMYAVDQTDDIIERMSDDMQDALGTGDEETIDSQRKEDRVLTISRLNTIANQIGQPDLLPQWTEEFQNFLIKNQSMMPPRMSASLKNILPYVDFENSTDVLPDANPCPQCGAIFDQVPVQDNEELVSPAMVGRGREYLCQVCHSATTRLNDMKYSLHIPVLAFLDMKKREYLNNHQTDYIDEKGRKRNLIADEIENLMNYTIVKISRVGASRSGTSAAGLGFLLIYNKGRMFLVKAGKHKFENAKDSQTSQDTIRDTIAWHGMPLEQLLSGVGFPTGGYAVGIDRDAPLGLGGPAVTEWGERTPDGVAIPTSGAGTKGRSLIQVHPFEMNEIVNTMVVNELLPMVLRDPGIQEQMQGVPPAGLKKDNTSASGVQPYAKRLIAVVNMTQQALALKYQRPTPLMALFESENQDLLAEAVFQIKRLLVRVPDEDIIKFLYTITSTIDHISKVPPEDLEHLNTGQILPLDESVYQDPKMQDVSDLNLVVDPETGLIPSPERKPQAAKVASAEGKISAVYSYLTANNIIPPEDSPTVINELKLQLVSDGILSENEPEANFAIQVAIQRIIFMRNKTQELSRELINKELPYNEDGIFQLSEVISNDLVNNLVRLLTTSSNKQIYPVLNMSPAMRYLIYSTSGNALISDYQLFRDLLLSLSGLFGLSDDYDVLPAYTATDASGKPISELASTRDLATARGGSGITFQDAFKEKMPEDSAFKHPRFIELTWGVNPKTDKPIAPGKIKIFSDQFAPEKLAKQYAPLFANVSQFQNVSPDKIIDQLKSDVLSLVKKYYIGAESELYTRNPVAAMRAASSFFIPTDLIDDSMDFVAETMIASGSKGFIDPLFVAGDVLFDIKEMVDRGEQPNNVVRNIQTKYPGIREPLLFKVDEDIRQGKGSATRAINALGSRTNVNILKIRTANSLKIFIKCAMKRMDEELEV